MYEYQVKGETKRNFSAAYVVRSETTDACLCFTLMSKMPDGKPWSRSADKRDPSRGVLLDLQENCDWKMDSLGPVFGHGMGKLCPGVSGSCNQCDTNCDTGSMGVAVETLSSPETSHRICPLLTIPGESLHALTVLCGHLQEGLAQR